MLLRGSMRSRAFLGVLILASVSLGGCIGDGETEDQSRFIDDESELFDPESPDYCGDFDGDGEPDCPLSGYIPETDPWWCNSTGIGGHHVDLAYEGKSKGLLSPELCEELTYELKDAIEWAAQWPTLGDAEDAGYTMSVGYTEGMGTHHVMLNNFSMAIELHIMQESTTKYRSTDISGDYAAMARAFGGYGERVTDPAEIVPAIKRGIEQTKQGVPVLLEFITSKEVDISIF